MPISPLIGWTGVATLLLAPFGAFAIDLSSITAAISMGREAHEAPDKRYVAGMAEGCFIWLLECLGRR
ncbi:MAG: benzoate/H(+) symporter BenE family transporter [Phormidesmis sp.]